MKPVRTAIIVTLFWTVVVGGMYPLLMYGVGAAFFPGQAQGSLLVKDGKVVGSALIGQDFSDNAFFHSRPSAITYDASNSGASNRGWTSSDQKDAGTTRRIEHLFPAGHDFVRHDLIEQQRGDFALVVRVVRGRQIDQCRIGVPRQTARARHRVGNARALGEAVEPGPADRARTPREYLALVAPEDPRKAGLAALTGSFERTWYGGRAAAETDYRNAEQLAAALISGSGCSVARGGAAQ